MALLALPATWRWRRLKIIITRDNGDRLAFDGVGVIDVNDIDQINDLTGSTGQADAAPGATA
jgi:hypothetical protein